MTRSCGLSLALFASLATAAVATPASSATCKRWQMNRQTFWIDQSDGFSIQVTPGSILDQGDGYIRFGTNGSLSYQRETGIFNQNTERAGGTFVRGIHFHKTHPGYVNFQVYWNSGLQGYYNGNIHNPRYHEGTLIADLKGPVTSNQNHASVTWTSRGTPIFCRPTDVVPDVDPRTQGAITLKFPDAAPPPPPKREIKVQGRATGSTAPRDPNRVGQFDLPFETQSSLGGKFDVKLQVVGTYRNPLRFHVTGTLTNTDIGSQYNGTFDGTFTPDDTRTVSLTYDQPAANARGTVVFRFSEDGETVTGQGLHMGHTPFQWNGRRKRGPN